MPRVVRLEVLVALGVLGPLGGCFAPPAVLEALGPTTLELASVYPDGTELVELAGADGATLRGVFVPAGERAPVVVHLLEASSSVGSQRLPRRALTLDLRDLGWASLIVDWSGVGASDGERSIEHIAGDARAMFAEAVRRAGQQSRVVVRATSLGTLAASLLLAEGAEPCGLIWIAPVEPDTIVGHFADHFYGAPLSWLARLVFRPVAETGPLDRLAHEHPPILVFAGSDDTFVSDGERKRLAGATSLAGLPVVERPDDHFELTAYGTRLFPEELPFLLERAGHSRTRAELEALRADWAVGRRARKRGLSAEAVRALCDLADPAGALPIDLLETCARSENVETSFRGSFVLDVDAIASLARGHGAGASGGRISLGWSIGPITVEIVTDLPELYSELVRRGLPAADARRQFARLVCKAQLIPDRVRIEADGTAVLEVAVLDGEHVTGWRRVDTDPIPAGVVAESAPGLE